VVCSNGHNKRIGGHAQPEPATLSQSRPRSAKASHSRSRMERMAWIGVLIAWTGCDICAARGSVLATQQTMMARPGPSLNARHTREACTADKEGRKRLRALARTRRCPELGTPVVSMTGQQERKQKPGGPSHKLSMERLELGQDARQIFLRRQNRCPEVESA